jgi:cytochrome b subunit of formate dehydrogenase
MKILYSKKQRKYHFFYALFWLLLGITGLFFSERKLSLIYLLHIFLSISYFYKYLKGTNYLITEKGVLKQNYIFGKKMDLSDIKSIKHFAGEYILRTYKRKMTINISWVDQSSLLDLTTE